MRVVTLSIAFAGCGEKGPVSCTALEDGEWTVEGDAMGMPMGATVTMDAEACSFTLSGWSMEMLSLPTGGSVDGTSISMEGDAHWSSGTATLSEDGSSAEGSCDDDGTSFTMFAGPFTGST